MPISRNQNVTIWSKYETEKKDTTWARNPQPIAHAKNRDELSATVSTASPTVLKHLAINHMNSINARSPPCTPCATNSFTISAEFGSAERPVGIQCAVYPVPISHHSSKWHTAASIR